VGFLTLTFSMCLTVGYKFSLLPVEKPASFVVTRRKMQDGCTTKNQVVFP